LLCYDLTTILRSRALHRVLSSVIQYAWRSYMLSRLYRKVKTFRSDLLTYLLTYLLTLPYIQPTTQQRHNRSRVGMTHNPDDAF
jgi:hypothetical protein